MSSSSTQSSPSSSHSTPSPAISTLSPLPSIKKLSEDVIAKIAAGEVVHRPASAIKELIENSLDAGAKIISLVLKEGGMKLIQIQDDGCGISEKDLPLVCERHTTSKITSSEDLKKVQTFGFRGEALASISHVAHVEITSFPASQKCALKMSYIDGKPTSIKPKPCAAKKGTTISITDLFYNVPTRRKTITNLSEEYNQVLKIVKNYAINNPHVTFACKKFGESLSDVQTPMNAPVQDVIQCIMGNSIANCLLPVSFDHLQQENLKFKLQGQITDLEFDGPKTQFILFINGRMVSSKEIKKIVEKVYTSKKGIKIHPFVYLSIQVPPENIDVNVHPTKEEVYLLNEKLICDTIEKDISTILDGLESSNEKKSKLDTNKNTSPIPMDLIVDNLQISSAFRPSSSSSSSSSNMPNSDQSNSTLDDFIDNEGPSNVQKKKSKQTTLDGNTLDTVSKNSNKRKQPVIDENDLEDFTTESKPKKPKRIQAEEELASILNIRAEIEEVADKSLTTAIRKNKFVGILDSFYSLIQYKDTLYLLNNEKVSEELFYQLIMKKFSKFTPIHLDPSPSLFDLLIMTLDHPASCYDETLGDKTTMTQTVVNFLLQKAPLLKEYYCIEITESGILLTLPDILPGYVPSLEKLPFFLLHLAGDTNWENEQECLGGVARHLAKFYSILPPSSETEIFSQISQANFSNTSSQLPLSNQEGLKPVLFEKKDKEDKPLQRAIDFCAKNTSYYLFSKEYPESQKSARFYLAQNPKVFFEEYVKLNASERTFDDVMREGYPLKFYADLEFEPTLFEENMEKEKQTNEMITAFKSYVELLWEIDTKRPVPLDSWIEFDATREQKKVSRHLHNDGMVFQGMEHLHTFMLRLQNRINFDIRESASASTAQILVVYRQKNGSKVKELFFDMLVYTRNRCMRLPWSTKTGEFRHLYPVVRQTVRRDISTPQWDLFKRVLSVYWEEGFPTVQPFAYSPDKLVSRSRSGNKLNLASLVSSTPPVDPSKSEFQNTIECTLLPSIRSNLLCPSSFLTSGAILIYPNIKQLIHPCSKSQIVNN